MAFIPYLVVKGRQLFPETKPIAKIKIQGGVVKEDVSGSNCVSNSTAPPLVPDGGLKKEEKMEVDDEDDLKLQICFTPNVSNVSKTDPFAPTPADFAVATASTDYVPAPATANKRGRCVVLLCSHSLCVTEMLFIITCSRSNLGFIP